MRRDYVAGTHCAGRQSPRVAKGMSLSNESFLLLLGQFREKCILKTLYAYFVFFFSILLCTKMYNKVFDRVFASSRS